MLDSKQQQGSEQQGIEHSFNSPLVCAKRGCKAITESGGASEQPPSGFSF